MEIELWVTLLVASLLISISPGAGMVNTMSNGILFGVKHTLPAILGLQLGYGIQIAIVGVGLGALLASSTFAFELVKWLGVAYLVWLGYKKWFQAPLSFESADFDRGSAQKRFWTAAFVNLTNPKATIFLVALFPQFIDPDAADNLMQYIVMGGTIIVADIIVMLGYAFLAAQLQSVMRNKKNQLIQNRVFGGLYVGIASLMVGY